MKSQANKSEIILYQTSDGTVRIDTVFRGETIWLSQAKMADLFDVKIPAISKHLKNIFKSGELDEKVVVSILENTTQHGAIEGKTQKKQVKHFNLDAIVAEHDQQINCICTAEFVIFVVVKMLQTLISTEFYV
jgi:hypothetical protein